MVGHEVHEDSPCRLHVQEFLLERRNTTLELVQPLLAFFFLRHYLMPVAVAAASTAAAAHANLMMNGTAIANILPSLCYAPEPDAVAILPLCCFETRLANHAAHVSGI